MTRRTETASEAGRLGRACTTWRSPSSSKGSFRKCGGCVEKVARLIPGGLRGCRGMPVQRFGAVRRVGSDGGGRKVVAHRGEVSRGRITSGIVGRWEGPNAKPSVRTFVLVIMAVTAANPARGLTEVV